MATQRNPDGSETVTDDAERARSRSLRPLRDLAPFLRPYRGMLLAANVDGAPFLLSPDAEVPPGTAVS